MRRGALVWLLVLAASCGAPPPPDGLADSTIHCYGLPAGTAQAPAPYVRIHLLGHLVNGTFTALPLNASAASGSFTGAVDDSLITVLATIPTDTGQVRYELIFRTEPGGIRFGDGERLYGDDIWLLRNKGHISYGPLLPEVECR